MLLALVTGLSVLFTITCFTTTGGLSLYAFLLALVFTLLFALSVARFIRSPSRKTLPLFRKLLEYLPFVLFAAFVIRRAGSSPTGFYIDLISAIVWTSLTIIGMIVQFRVSDKRISRYYHDLEDPVVQRKSFVIHVFEWIDALLQAA